MMELNFTTPAVLLSTISLLMLAYTNRFLTLTGRARDLCAHYREDPQAHLLIQLKNLRRRIHQIRDTQTIGVFSLFLFVLSMFLIFQGQQLAAHFTFGLGLILLMLSLVISTLELYQSCRAIDTEFKALKDLSPEESSFSRSLHAVEGLLHIKRD